MNDEREVRCLMAGCEVRAAPESKGPGTIVGYAAVFDKFSEDLGRFIERIRPGAFADALKTSDVRALVNHDPNQLIGRSKAGTLRMGEDGLGLRTEIDLPDTQLGRDTAESIRRGDMDGMSFSFFVAKGGDTWDYSGDIPVRTVTKYRKIVDVGPVTDPAYTDTSIAMRSLNSNRPEPEATPDPEPEPVPDLTSAWARQRLAEATLLLP